VNCWATTESGLLVPQPNHSRVTAVDLFAGAGGFSLGLHQAGIDVVAAVEWNAEAAISYLWNLGHRGGAAVLYGTAQDQQRFHASLVKLQRGRRNRFEVCPGDPHWIGWNNPDHDLGCRAFHLGDVAELTGEQLVTALAATGWRGAIDLVVGGPPCQGISRANTNGGPTDPRNNLVLEHVRLAGELGAKVFILENVPPLIRDQRFRPLFRSLVETAHEAGFQTVSADVVDAANYGVPQYRQRAFVVGTRGSAAIRLPLPSHWGNVFRPGELPGGASTPEAEPQQAPMQGSLFGGLVGGDCRE